MPKKDEVIIDSITTDKNGKVLVISVNGKPITDPQEISKILKPKDKGVKDD